MTQSRISESVQFLKSHFGNPPEVAVVLGSGLSGYLSELEDSKVIPFSQIPGGHTSSVQGHDGRLGVGAIKKKRVAVFAGRIHGYEGHRPDEVVHLLRAVLAWGCKNWILTNATGSTSLPYKPGSLVLIKDQLNLTFRSPLEGKELFGGPRFPDMSDLYSLAWRKRILKVSQKAGLSLKQGVYTGVSGPQYETPAEVKMIRKLGGDIVGMSTVWEAIALRQMGAQVSGISCVSNYCTGISKKSLTHQEVLDVAAKAQKKFIELLNLSIECA